MNIAFFIPQLSNGGAERVVANLANTMAQTDNLLSVITTRRDDNEYSISSKIKRFVLNEAGLTTNRFINKFIRLKELRRICKDENIDVLVAFLRGAVDYSILACLGLKTKVIISERNSPSFTYPTQMDKLYTKIFLPLADGADFQTEDAKKWFSKSLQRKSVVIPNPINDCFYNVDYTPVENSVISVGRLTAQKNYPLLIKAFRRVVNKKTLAKLYIYGEGELANTLQKNIDDLNLSNNVILKGRHNNISLALKNASLFVMSSDVEGMPNALLEAMAIGVPAISTNCPCGGPKMLLSNGRGILVPLGNEIDLANKILEMLSSTELRNMYSKKSREYSKQFTQNEISNKWLKFIEQVF